VLWVDPTAATPPQWPLLADVGARWLGPTECLRPALACPIGPHNHVGQCGGRGNDVRPALAYRRCGKGEVPQGWEGRNLDQLPRAEVGCPPNLKALQLRQICQALVLLRRRDRGVQLQELEALHAARVTEHAPVERAAAL